MSTPSSFFTRVAQCTDLLFVHTSLLAAPPRSMRSLYILVPALSRSPCARVAQKNEATAKTLLSGFCSLCSLKIVHDRTKRSKIDVSILTPPCINPSCCLAHSVPSQFSQLNIPNRVRHSSRRRRLICILTKMRLLSKQADIKRVSSYYRINNLNRTYIKGISVIATRRPSAAKQLTRQQTPQPDHPCYTEESNEAHTRQEKLHRDVSLSHCPLHAFVSPSFVKRAKRE